MTASAFMIEGEGRRARPSLRVMELPLARTGLARPQSRLKRAIVFIRTDASLGACARRLFLDSVIAAPGIRRHPIVESARSR